MKKRKAIGIFGAVLFCLLVAASAGAGAFDDGTVMVRNLVWLRDPDCFGKHSWYEISSRVNSLQDGQCYLHDGSKAGDWRLPTAEELLSLYACCRSMFYDVKYHYWTRDEFYSDPSKAYWMDFAHGYARPLPKNVQGYGWPVRNRRK